MDNYERDYSRHAGQAMQQQKSYLGGEDAIQQPSVNQCADKALEASAQVHQCAYALWSDLRQATPEAAQGKATPCRSGIDGKLTDAFEHSSETLRLLQEIRLYLLG